MNPSTAIELILVVSAFAAVTRLLRLNLGKRFPALLAYLAFIAVINLGLGFLNPASAFYFWSYIVLEPLKCVFSIFAVREIFSLTFHDYPGIRTVGRWVMYAGVALALGISLLLTGFFWSGTARGRAHSHLYYFEISQRSVVFTLAVVIAAVLIFLSKYPMRLGWNTRVSSAFFSILFLCEAAQLLIDSVSPRLYNLAVDWSANFFVVLCLIGWTVLLQPETERVPAQIRFSTPREEYLLQQLNSLNQLMTRAARR
jgi:hypothetical protein